MLFNTDILIWVLRGNAKAASAADRIAERSVSAVTYMELLQGARDKQEVKTIKSFMANMQLRILPLTENIGHRASIYMEEYGLSVALSMADALIAATAIENGETLFTGNRKHYQSIKELELKVFRP